MSSTDVRSILELPPRDDQASSSSAQQNAPRRSTSTLKKPDGISRELYALIGDNAPFLAETQAALSATKYRERPKPKIKDARWFGTDIWANESTANFLGRCYHSYLWPASHKVDTVFDTGSGSVTGNPSSQVGTAECEHSLISVEYFGSFNIHGPTVMEYSQYEYDQHLGDPDWTSQETTYLFNLLREFDLRFIVVADRYSFQNARTRTVEVSAGVSSRSDWQEIKDRYFAVCRRLIRTRTASDPSAQTQQMQAHAFDKG